MYCAIDFGTSNSAIAVPQPQGGTRLVPLEDGRTSMPTAVFYAVEGERAFGRAAIAAYVDGIDGRLMRSMKSILGSDLVERSTDVGGGRPVRYLDVIGGYLRHLKARAEESCGAPISRALLGRPVFFVDDDAARDRQAEAALAAAARSVGFDEVHFQYEPIAAAFDHERSVPDEQTALVVDIGGGTSDFSVVRIGPARAKRPDRRDDILANHGIHIAGTDFDRRIELATILPLAGYGARGPGQAGAPGREVPSGIYFDLATWHLINTCYVPQRVAEWRGMHGWFERPEHHDRLMVILTERLGHDLAARAEAGNIEVADGGDALIALEVLERGLRATLTELPAARAAHRGGLSGRAPGARRPVCERRQRARRRGGAPLRESSLRVAPDWSV
jgi:hypothetical chaperone protein